MTKTNLYNIFLAFQHSLTDSVSAYVVLSSLRVNINSYRNIIMFVLIYNFVAFGTQFIFGYLSDKFGLGQIYVLLSTLVAVSAIIFQDAHPLIPILLVGFANSLFHIGGGSIVLKTSKYKAAYSGIFIAPGAIGLLLGTVYANSAVFKVILTVLILIFFLINFYMYKNYDYRKENVGIREMPITSKGVSTLLLCLLSIVAIRSLVGFSLPFPWRSTLPNVVLVFTFFIFIGKVLGGVIAEKFGLIKTALLSLSFSILLILIGKTIPLVGMFGILLLQMTTAITLVLIYRALPDNPGVSFGFTTLAIFVGATPMLTNNLNLIKSPFGLLVSGVSAVIMMFIVSGIFNNGKHRRINSIIKI